MTTLVTVGMNYLIDPYGIFGSPTWAAINEKKPAAANRTHIVKPYAVKRDNYAVIIVGNSRPQMGLDPDHPCIQSIGSAYSLTLPGAGVYQQARYLQHALSYSQPKLIILGIDFIDFLISPNEKNDPYRWPPYTDKFEERLAVDPQGRRNFNYFKSKIFDYRDSLFSLITTKDSIQTIKTQNLQFSSTLNSNGFNPANDYFEIIKHEGQHMLFKQKNEELLETLTRSKWQIIQNNVPWSSPLTSLNKIIEEATSREIRLIVFINPYHADYIKNIITASQENNFKQWKIIIEELVVKKNHLEFWDFSVINAYTSESPPQPNDKKTILNWFWEPAHYRKELGDKLLDQMLAKNGCA